MDMITGTPKGRQMQQKHDMAAQRALDKRIQVFEALKAADTLAAAGVKVNVDGCYIGHQ